MAQVNGIGGIFFGAEDPQKLKAWYERHLGITNIFLWRDADHPSTPGHTLWNVFPKTSRMFDQTTKEFVINYRVDDLVRLLSTLTKENCTIIGEMESNDDGKFAYLLDAEHNKIVLWEPSAKIPNVASRKLDRVTGIGGIFFKTTDKAKLKEWYVKKLGLNITKWGCTFQWIDQNDTEAKVPARTEWSPFPSDTDYFQPSQKEFMFNYRVKDLVKLTQNLKSEGVEIVSEIQEFSYGKFTWIVDPEMNKIELWEPKDDGF